MAIGYPHQKITDQLGSKRYKSFHILLTLAMIVSSFSFSLFIISDNSTSIIPEPSQTITGVKTWTGVDDHKVVGNITIAPGGILNIDEDTIVYFDGYHFIYVEEK